MNKLINPRMRETNLVKKSTMNLSNNPNTALSMVKASSTLNKLMFDLSHDNVGLLDNSYHSREPEESEALRHKNSKPDENSKSLK